MKNFRKVYLLIKGEPSKKKINEKEMLDELVSYRNFMRDVYNIDICKGWSDGLRGEELYKALMGQYYKRKGD